MGRLFRGDARAGHQRRPGCPPGWRLPALFVAALVIGGLLGTVLEFALLRRILDKDPILQLLVTFAAFMVLEDLQRLIWGVQPVFVSDVVNQLGTLSVAGVTYTRYQLLVLPVVAVAALLRAALVPRAERRSAGRSRP